MRIRRLLLGVSLSLVGCASVTNVQRADTLGKGNFQVGIEPGVQGAAAGSVFLPYPHLDGSIRFGVSDGVDLGLRAGWSFLELQGKFLVTRPGDPKYAVSIAPTVGGIFLGVGGAGASASVGLLNFGLPVLVGFKFGPHELVLGPRLQGYYLFASGGSSSASTSAGAFILAGGASVGFAFAASETLSIMPEFGLVVPFVGAASVGGSSTTAGALGGAGSVIGQFKVGILIGKQRKSIDENAEDLSAPPPPPPAVEGPPPPPLPR